MNFERQMQEEAITQARRAQAEDSQHRPKVGAVAAQGQTMLGSAFRGEMAAGDHAEFTLLEKKLKDTPLAGATVYTTLEPCTTRNHPKIPCAARLVERKVSRVVIGMLDPNPKISGKGFQRLRDAGIEVLMFPTDLQAQIEELNRDFIRSFRDGVDPIQNISPELVEQLRHRSLDDWYKKLNGIYWDRNFGRGRMELFVHLVEAFGGISLLASDKSKPNVHPEHFVPKALAWWLTLSGSVGVRSVSDMLWAKFPFACPYCQRNPHDPDECLDRKASNPGVDWEALARIGQQNARQKPSSLSDWQRMFGELYPVQQGDDYRPAFARLTEELGELAESLRIFPASPGYFLSEAADLFAWLMRIQNISDSRSGRRKGEKGHALETMFSTLYPDRCVSCGESRCTCPALRRETIGRIAHEVPPRMGSYGDGGSFLAPDRILATFQPPS
jgi:pyrimidine deaminase RibD-like protein